MGLQADKSVRNISERVLSRIENGLSFSASADQTAVRGSTLESNGEPRLEYIHISDRNGSEFEAKEASKPSQERPSLV